MIDLGEKVGGRKQNKINKAMHKLRQIHRYQKHPVAKLNCSTKLDKTQTTPAVEGLRKICPVEFTVCM